MIFFRTFTKRFFKNTPFSIPNLKRSLTTIQNTFTPQNKDLNHDLTDPSPQNKEPNSITPSPHLAPSSLETLLQQLTKPNSNFYPQLVDLIQSFQTQFSSPNKNLNQIQTDLCDTLKKISETNNKTLTKLFTQHPNLHPYISTQMQTQIFSNLQQLSLPEIQTLFAHWKSQKSTQLHSELINTVHKPFLKEIFLRFQSLDMQKISEMLLDYSQPPHNSGLYSLPELEQKITEYILTVKPSIIENKRKTISIHYNFLYFAHITGFLNEQMAMYSSKTIEPALYLFTLQEYLKFGALFSRFTTVNQRFWLSFAKHSSEIDKTESQELRFLFGLTMIRLKFSEPRVQTRIFKGLPFSAQDLIFNFKAEKGLNDEKNENSDKKLLCEVLQEKKLQFSSGFYDGVLIDIAITHKRIAYQLCDPSHYIWPSGRFNGSFADKLFLLEKKDWKVITIKFSEATPPNARKSELQQIILQSLSETD